MIRLLTLLLCGAPVPSHLFPPPCDDVVPGYRWYYAGDVLRVTHEDGELVWFANDTRPSHGWNMGHGYNVQTKATTAAEAKKYGRPR